MKRCIFLIFLILPYILQSGCYKKKTETQTSLPEIESMGFSIPKKVSSYYRKLHKKGDAKFTYEEFFGTEVRLPRPIFEKENKLNDIKELIEVKTYLGKFGKADELVSSYLKKQHNSQYALSYAGHYYLKRNRVDRALHYLFLAAKKQKKTSPWFELIDIAKKHNLSELKYKYINSLISAFPDSVNYLKKKISELKKDKKTQELRKTLKKLYTRFPDQKRYYLKESQLLSTSLNREKDAIALYSKELDPLVDITATYDFFSFLRSQYKMEKYKRIWKKRGDEKSSLFLFLYYLRKGYRNEAENLIADFIKKHPNKLLLLAALYNKLHYPLYAYNYYLKVISKKGENPDVLYDIFCILVNGNIASGGKSTTDAIFNFDKSPNITGGLLSLYYNTLDFNRRNNDLSYVKTKIVNLSFAYRIFSYILQRYPDTHHADSLYIKMMEAFNSAHLYKRVVELGNTYIRTFKRGNYIPIYEMMASAYLAMGDKDRGNSMFRKLLSRLSKENKVDEYHNAFNRFISELISQKDYTSCISLYWSEIKKHPKDEKLYRKFLSFINNYNLYTEELKVYKYAIRHFDQKTWYHKLARWYIRHRSVEEFRQITEQVKKTFDDKELVSYLKEFVHFSPRISYDAPGNRFYLAMYSYGIKKFPDNVNFAKGLIKFYSSYHVKYRSELLRLYKRYFFYDEGIRNEFIRYLAKNGLLRDYLKIAKEHNGVLYMLFQTEAENYLSMYEETEKPLLYLTLLYPDRAEFAIKLAHLYQSIDFSYYHEDQRLTEKGIGVFLRTVKLFPTFDTSYTQLGEMFVEANRYTSAKTEWMKKIDLAQGEEKQYKDVAAILWDYYDFTDAITVIKKARANLSNDTLLAKEIAALYEELQNYRSAIREYIKSALFSKSYTATNDAIKRLIYLNKTRNIGTMIENIFTEMIKNARKPDRLVLLYAKYLGKLGKNEKKLKMYKTVLPLLKEPTTIRYIINGLEAGERSNLTINYAKRLVTLTDATQDYLLLAATYENQKNLKSAGLVYKNLLNQLKSEKNQYLNVLTYYAEFLWRHKDYDHSLDRLFDAQSIAKGNKRSSILKKVANRAISIGKLGRAKKALTLLINENPYNTSYFNLLGDIYEKLRDEKGLKKTYLERIKLIKKASINYQKKRNHITELYLGLARRLSKLGLKTEALDYYIEAINRNPLDTTILDEVYTFSRNNNLTKRLIDFYKKTSHKSFKDYRWQLVLERFYLHNGNIKNAVEQLKMAVENQPQKANLHEELADKLTLLGEYKSAIEEYQMAYTLSKDKNQITRKIALIYLRQGEKQKMLSKFDELIKATANDPTKYFDIARTCLDYGLTNVAFQYSANGVKILRKHPYRGYFSDKILSTLAVTFIKKGRTAELLDFLLKQYQFYNIESKKEKSFKREEAYTRGSRIRYFINSEFINIFNNFSNESDRNYLSEKFDTYTLFSYTSSIVNSILQFSKEAGVPDLAEKILLWKYKNIKKEKHYRSFYAITSFYKRRGTFKKEYNFLKEESNDYARLAVLARLVNPEEEIDWLRKSYAENRWSSKVFTSFSPLIERYLDILKNNNMEKEMSVLTKQFSFYNGQILNYFYRNKNGPLAFEIIDNGFPKKSKLWKETKKAIVSFGLNYKRNEGIAYFKNVLDVRTIGEKVEKRRYDVLTGDDFFVNGFIFGIEDSSFLYSRIEATPRNSRNYKLLGNYYYENKQYKKALNYFQKALKLKQNTENLTGLAKTYLALGDVKNSKMVLVKIDGVGFDKKREYINALAQLGFQRDAEIVLKKYLNQSIDSLNYNETEKAIKLIYKTVSAYEPFLIGLAKNIKTNSEFFRIILRENLVKNKLFFIKEYIGLVERGKPHKDLYLRHKFVDELFREGKLQNCQKLLNDTKKITKQDNLPAWVILKQAEVLIKRNKTKDGIALLENFVTQNKNYLSVWTELLNILSTAGKDGLKLRKKIYSDLINNENDILSNYLGLAETNLLMGEDTVALQVLNRLALKVDYSPTRLLEAAKLLYKYKKFESANLFLKKILIINPAMPEAKLLEARLLIANNRKKDACEIAVNLLLSRVKQEFKKEAAEIITPCGDTALQVLNERLEYNQSLDLYLAKARLLADMGKKTEAKETLEHSMMIFKHYTSDIPLFISKLSDTNESMKYLYRALYIKYDQKDILVPLLVKLMALKRDQEVKELITTSFLSPSGYLDWYDEEEGRKEYIERVKKFLPSDKNSLNNLLYKTANFYERIGNYNYALFILKSCLSDKNKDTISKEIKKVEEEIKRNKKREKFIIKEDLANGEKL